MHFICVIRYIPERWIGNCVGLHNMKPFLLFLFYGILTAIVSVCLSLVEIVRCWIIYTPETDSEEQG